MDTIPTFLTIGVTDLTAQPMPKLNIKGLLFFVCLALITWALSSYVPGWPGWATKMLTTVVVLLPLVIEYYRSTVWSNFQTQLRVARKCSTCDEVTFRRKWGNVTTYTSVTDVVKGNVLVEECHQHISATVELPDNGLALQRILHVLEKNRAWNIWPGPSKSHPLVQAMQIEASDNKASMLLGFLCTNRATDKQHVDFWPTFHKTRRGDLSLLQFALKKKLVKTMSKLSQMTTSEANVHVSVEVLLQAFHYGREAVQPSDPSALSVIANMASYVAKIASSSITLHPNEERATVWTLFLNEPCPGFPLEKHECGWQLVERFLLRCEQANVSNLEELKQQCRFPPHFVPTIVAAQRDRLIFEDASGIPVSFD